MSGETEDDRRGRLLRDRVRELFTACLGCGRRGARLELSTYNWAVQNARADGLPTYWANPVFKRRYSDKSRSLLYNLRNPETPHLREALLNAQDLQPYRDLPGMSHEDMFPARWLAAHQELNRSRRKGQTEVPRDFVGLYQCNRCRSWRCTFSLLQTRASDEPTTAFCLCHDCGKRWRMNA